MRETTSTSDTECSGDHTPLPADVAAAPAGAPAEQMGLSAPAPGSWATRLSDLATRAPWLPLALALLLAVAARLFLVVRTHAMIDGDEALVGIQAERILHGQYPTYFYGQAYMGSLEAYLAAAVFRVFGPSSWALRAVPIALSLLLVYLTWRLARALLPRDAAWAALLAGLAALAAAVPPLYDAVAELRTWGGQIEIYVVTVALLLATVELADRMRAGAGAFELSRRWAVWGFVLGLGVWINPLISYALLACGLWLVAPYVGRAFPRLWLPVARRFGADAPARKQPAWRPGAALPLLALLPGLALGGLPAWLYALRNAGENLLVYVTQPSVSPAMSGAARHGRLFLGAAITARYFSCVAPRVLDGGLPAEPLAELPLRLLLVLPPLAGIACALWLVARRASSPLRVGLPVLYGVVVTAVFCLGTSAWGATKACSMDWAGRYAVSLTLVAPFLLLALFASPAAWTALHSRLSAHAVSSSGGWSALLARRGWSLALAVLLVAGAAQAGTYALAAPSSTFQSPYYRRIGLDQDQLLTYLQTHGIHYAWANHWEGNIVTFESNGATTCADYYDQVVMHGLHRPPGALEAVEAATAPSFILIGTDPHPLLAQELDAQGIPYTMAVLPRSNVTVLTPGRTVDPATVVPGLAVDYPY